MLKTSVKIMWNNNDITKDLEPFLIGMTYKDALSGESDVVELTLQDANHALIENLPPRGSAVNVTVNDFNFGSFELDEITYSAPPSVMRVKANSISQTSALRQEDLSKSWENVLLSKIARDIADASNVELFYQADYDPTITRAEQGEQSRLSFLQNLCVDNGLCLKVSDNKLIVCEESSLEAQEPVATLTWSDVTRFDATATLNEVYQKCEVNYRHGQKDKNFSAVATDDTKSTGRTLRINKRVNSQAEADRLARHKLREANKKEFEVSLTLPLNLRLLAGVTVDLDFGFFSDKWIVDESSHSVSDSGSQSRIKLHKVESQ
ncbi:MAG: hypothetical protein IJG33_00140 [Selenomonadaceae bacterium]|nr:hypothetical protein [Selenomonadaceae bacterium]